MGLGIVRFCHDEKNEKLVYFFLFIFSGFNLAINTEADKGEEEGKEIRRLSRRELQVVGLQVTPVNAHSPSLPTVGFVNEHYWGELTTQQVGQKKKTRQQRVGPYSFVHVFDNYI